MRIPNQKAHKPTPNFYEPSDTESDSSSEHSTFSYDSEDRISDLSW